MDSGTVDLLVQPASPFKAPKDLRGSAGKMKRLQRQLPHQAEGCEMGGEEGPLGCCRLSPERRQKGKEESLDWADLCRPGLSLQGQVGYGGGIMEKPHGSFQMKSRLAAGV